MSPLSLRSADYNRVSSNRHARDAHLGTLHVITEPKSTCTPAAILPLKKETHVKVTISLSSLQSESIRKLDSLIQKFKKFPCKHSFAVNA